jgi:hypothetical protein
MNLSRASFNLIAGPNNHNSSCRHACTHHFAVPYPVLLMTSISLRNKSRAFSTCSRFAFTINLGAGNHWACWPASKAEGERSGLLCACFCREGADVKGPVRPVWRAAAASSGGLLLLEIPACEPRLGGRARSVGRRAGGWCGGMGVGWR